MSELPSPPRSEEHTSELQSLRHLVCRLLLEAAAGPPDLPPFPTRRSSDLSTPKLVCSTPEELAAERAGLAGEYLPFWMSQAEHNSMDLAAKCVQRTGLALLSHVGTAESAEIGRAHV